MMSTEVVSNRKLLNLPDSIIMIVKAIIIIAIVIAAFAVGSESIV